MSKSPVIAFLEEIANNKQLAEDVEKVVGGKDSVESKTKELLSLAKKHHFNFTQEDVASIQGAKRPKISLNTKLSSDGLDEVSGGKGSLKSSLMAFTLLTGLGVGGAALSSMEASAMKTDSAQGQPAVAEESEQHGTQGRPAVAEESEQHGTQWRPAVAGDSEQHGTQDQHQVTEESEQHATLGRPTMDEGVALPKKNRKLETPPDFGAKDKEMLKKLYSEYRQNQKMRSCWDDIRYGAIYRWFGWETRGDSAPYTAVTKTSVTQLSDDFMQLSPAYKTKLQNQSVITYNIFFTKAATAATHRIVVNTKTQEDTLKILRNLVDAFATKKAFCEHIKHFKGYFTNPVRTFKYPAMDTGAMKIDKIVIYFRDEDDTKQEILNLIKDSEAELVPNMSAFYQTGLYEDKDDSDPCNCGVGLGCEVDEMASFTGIRAKLIAQVLKPGESQLTEDEFIKKVKEKFWENGINPSTPHLQDTSGPSGT